MRPGLVLVFVVAAGCSSKTGDAPKLVPKPTRAPRDAAARCDPKAGHVCSGDSVVECNPDGSFGAAVQTCNDGCSAGACSDPCATHGNELIYLVDDDRDLLSFDPTKLPGDPFHVVAKLACDPSSHPFSMAVDRRGIAWVMYQSGRLYRVSILDGHCADAGDLDGPDDRPRLFGMGFAADAIGSDRETLFTVGSGPGAFGTLDVSASPAVWHRLGTTLADADANAPDLTGTRNGEVFGYFPEVGAASTIRQLEPSTGGFGTSRWTVPTHGDHAEAWAFAFWGGVFYVFATFDDKPGVYAVHRKTGKVDVLGGHAAYRVTGAGVSTCAPELERAE